MGSKGWIKRVLPFFATFAIGIFIAGLFGFGGPRFGRHGRWQMRAEMERLRAENEELKNENLRLRNDRTLCDRYVDPTTGDETLYYSHPLAKTDLDEFKGEGPSLDRIPLTPPAAPMAHRPPRHDR